MDFVLWSHPIKSTIVHILYQHFIFLLMFHDEMITPRVYVFEIAPLRLILFCILNVRNFFIITLPSKTNNKSAYPRQP